ncbi:unnamed protein product [Closterium sp. NIES-54]
MHVTLLSASPGAQRHALAALHSPWPRAAASLRGLTQAQRDPFTRRPLPALRLCCCCADAGYKASVPSLRAPNAVDGEGRRRGRRRRNGNERREMETRRRRAWRSGAGRPSGGRRGGGAGHAGRQAAGVSNLGMEGALQLLSPFSFPYLPFVVPPYPHTSGGGRRGGGAGHAGRQAAGVSNLGMEGALQLLSPFSFPYLPFVVPPYPHTSGGGRRGGGAGHAGRQARGISGLHSLPSRLSFPFYFLIRLCLRWWQTSLLRALLCCAVSSGTFLSGAEQCCRECSANYTLFPFPLPPNAFDVALLLLHSLLSVNSSFLFPIPFPPASPRPQIHGNGAVAATWSVEGVQSAITGPLPFLPPSSLSFPPPQVRVSGADLAT